MKLLFFLLIFLLIMQLTVMDAEAQRKITGPWLWMIAPTSVGRGGAASTDVDSLSAASGGRVTEAAIAANGATAGDAVGALVWTLGEISETGGNNINDVITKIGLGRGDINDHSSYALITLESRRAQRVQMRVGSDDSIKVWLNGTVVHRNAVDRGAGDFQDTFQVDIKQGDNLLLVKVSERGGGWSMFVGVNADVNAVYKPPSGDPTGGGAGTLVSVDPSSIASPRIGQQFTVNVKITGGKNVAGYQLTLRFDRTALRYVSGENADYLVDPFVVPAAVDANEVTLAATSLGVLSQGDGTLATLTFEVLAVKASMLTLTHVTLADAQSNFLPVHIESGQVNRSAIPETLPTDVPTRIEIVPTSGPYISRENVVEPRGGDFSGEIPLTFTVWSRANTRMRNQTVRLTTDSSFIKRNRRIDVSLSATTIRTANSANPTAKAILTLQETSTGTRTIDVIARVADIRKTLRLVVRQTAAALSITSFERNVTAGDEIPIAAEVRSRNGTAMPEVTVNFIESSNRIAFAETRVETETDGKAISVLRTGAAGTAQFHVEVAGLPRQTFNVTVSEVVTPAREVPDRIAVVPTPDRYISSNNVVEPKGGNFSGQIPLTFTVWSQANTRMRNQTVRLTADSSIAVSLSAATVRTANSATATATATLTLEETSTGTKIVAVTARVADISETLRLTVKQTAASFSVDAFERNVTAGDEISVAAEVRSRNGTVLPNVVVGFGESSPLISFTSPSVRTNAEGKARSSVRTSAAGTAQFTVSVLGVQPQTFNITVSEAVTPAGEVPGRIAITFTPTPYISRDNIVEPRGGDFSGEIPLTFTVWSQADTQMRDQTIRLTTNSAIDVSLSATTVRTANSGTATATATLTLEETSTGTQTVTVTASAGDISETLRLTIKQTAASLSITPFGTNVTVGDEIPIEAQVRSRNGTWMPNVVVGFDESAVIINFTATSVRTNVEGKASSSLRTSGAGTAQFIVSVLGVQSRTFNITIAPKAAPAEFPDRIEIVPTPGPYIRRDNVVEPRGGDFSGEIPLTFTVWSQANTRMQNQTLQLTVDSPLYTALSATTVRTANSATATATATLTLERTSTGVQTVDVTAKVADITGTLTLTVKQTAASLRVEGVGNTFISGDTQQIAVLVKSRNTLVMPDVQVRFKESSGLIAFSATDVQTGPDGRAYSLITTGGAGKARFGIEIPGLSEEFFDIEVVTQTGFTQQHYEFSSRQGSKTWYGWNLGHYTLKRKFFFPGDILELQDVTATVTVKGQGRLEFIENYTHYAGNWVEVAIRAKEHREKPTKLRVALQAKFKRQGAMPGAPSAQARAVPEMTTVLPNYPNPFNPETWIPYYLAEPAEVTLTIYSAEGRLIRTLALGYQLAGFYRNKGRAAYWDGRNNLGEPVASGIYFYTLSAGEFSKTHKMLVVK